MRSQFDHLIRDTSDQEGRDGWMDHGEGDGESERYQKGASRFCQAQGGERGGMQDATSSWERIWQGIEGNIAIEIQKTILEAPCSSSERRRRRINRWVGA